ncbi:MAG: LysR family transcriptional regulator [Acidobacteriaceae bacterium]
MFDLVEFRHLKYIAAIAETANFTRAAERLFLAQPSLSKQIKDLEDGIGIQIFVRHHDGVRITAAGQMVVSYAIEAVKTRNEIILAARAVHTGEIPALRIGFPRLAESGGAEILHRTNCRQNGEISRLLRSIMLLTT